MIIFLHRGVWLQISIYMQEQDSNQGCEYLILTPLNTRGGIFVK